MERRRGAGKLERGVQRDILLALGSRPDVRLWRANVGAGVNASGQLVRFGKKGQPDLTGFIRPEGWRLDIEVKREQWDEDLRGDQLAFSRVLAGGGCCYILAQSAAEASAALESFLRERRTGAHAPGRKVATVAAGVKPAPSTGPGFAR